MSPFSPHHAPRPHPSLPPTLETIPFGFVHVSFIHCPWWLFTIPLIPVLYASLEVSNEEVLRKYLLNKEMNFWSHRLHKDIQNNHVLNRLPSLVGSEYCMNWLGAAEVVGEVSGGKGWKVKGSEHHKIICQIRSETKWGYWLSEKNYVMWITK